ncbi:hypothetical protein DPMN_008855 [Dreissena polymorpha]|uniref:Uncharacterized protein n=1 Tax=Dreissena polymorpha TaxID=45954 RepID=A0A9D4N053_DREPO|nr:hypothetical protein DPMN_008855 [Dreissena polymorpha]
MFYWYQYGLSIAGGYTGDIHSNSNLTNKNDLYEYKFATGQGQRGSNRPWKQSSFLIHKLIGDNTTYLPQAPLAQREVHVSHCCCAFAENQWLGLPTEQLSTTTSCPYLRAMTAMLDSMTCSGDIRTWEETQSNCCRRRPRHKAIAVHSALDTKQLLNCCRQRPRRKAIATQSNCCRRRPRHKAIAVHSALDTKQLLNCCRQRPRRKAIATQSNCSHFTGRYGHTMVAFDRHLYVFGGATGQTLPNDLHW